MKIEVWALLCESSYDVDVYSSPLEAAKALVDIVREATPTNDDTDDYIMQTIQAEHYYCDGDNYYRITPHEVEVQCSCHN